MTLRLYNTLTRQKEEFKPIDPADVRMYVCGPTVYDFAHIGNARPVIVFDVLFRLLRHLYGENHVTYVRNITDVDDKINARALRDFGKEIDAGKMTLNEAIRKVTEKTANQFQSDVKEMGCLDPTHQPRATGFIDQMVEMIQKLLDLGFAYVAEGEEGREALFDVRAMPDYGKLSRRTLEDQKAGARIAVERHKRNPEDFVLWKESRSSEPGWHATFMLKAENQKSLRLNSNTISIFGRPGWHIECSAMSKRYLGEVFDIHGGGLDLIFPHHENEIAQSRCAHDTEVMANVWMHNGFLQVEGQKMSKSLGNFVTISELLETEKFHRKWNGLELRIAMLMTNYRQPIDWTKDRLIEASAKLATFRNSVRLAVPEKGNVIPAVVDALRDDLNTHEALKRLENAFSSPKNDLACTLVWLGLMSESDINFELGRQVASGVSASVAKAITNMDLMEQAIELRSTVRKRAFDNTLSKLDRDAMWLESDRIRNNELAPLGVEVSDTKDSSIYVHTLTGKKWEVKR